MKRTTEAHEHAVVHLDCEVCAERSVVSIPPQRAPYGIVDCAGCGATYLIDLESDREDRRFQAAF